MTDPSPLSVPDPLPLGLTDPAAFIAQPHFHKSTSFRPSCSPDEDHAISYAVVGSTDAHAPWVVWSNGMGAHRLAGAFLDGLAAERGVRLVAFDRPGAGRSKGVPLEHRVEASYEALLAVLEAEGIKEFGLLTHSNGFIYALFALPRLSLAGIRVTAWALSAPWVPPWLSGSPLLTVARLIPAPLTARLGSIFGAVEAAIGPVGSALGWSSGAARQVVSFSGGIFGGGETAPASTPGQAASPSPSPSGPRGRLSPQQQFLLDAKKDRDKPPHRRTYGRRFYSPKSVDTGMAVVVKEGVAGVGDEALLALAKGAGANWGWGQRPADGFLHPELQYEEGLRAVRTAWGDRPALAPRRLRVWYGEGDMIVPGKGQAYLRRLMVDELKLVEKEDWVQMKDAGHDDIIGLTAFAEPMLDMFVAAAGGARRGPV